MHGLSDYRMFYVVCKAQIRAGLENTNQVEDMQCVHIFVLQVKSHALEWLQLF